MRLTCPNCDAQYEVDDDAIPETGRDVQCSNCGQTWFQAAAGAVADAEVEAEAEVQPEGTETADISQDASQDSDKDQVAESEPEIDVAGDDATEQPALPPDTAEDPGEAHQRRALDEAVMDVLRQEADIEIRARDNEAGGLETQPDLGLAPAEGSSDAAIRERTARTPGEEEAPADSGHRRDLLPDIEEINSTLRAESDRDGFGKDGSVADEPQRQRSAFRRGFALVLLLLTAALGVYVYAPTISQTWPGTADALGSYVNWVNGLRVWLDGAMNSVIEAISGPTED
ncbi:MAG: zinc-ribbon domain-containing protein, partial [Halocynthiibacter sp.]